MPHEPNRPTTVETDAKAYALDDDSLLKDPIDDQWIALADHRICREFARQLIQQENMSMTTNNLTRLGNIRGLDFLERQLARIARHRAARGARVIDMKTVNDDEAFADLKRRLSPQLERAGAERDSEGAQS